MPTSLDDFAVMTWPQAVGWLTAINVAMFVLSLVGGEGLVRVFRNRPVSRPPEPLETTEVLLAALCVVLNTGVGVAGWFLWQAGYITVVRDASIWRILLDVLVLLVAMDFAMYVFHRLAHFRWIYGLLHATHHKYDRPRPLNLFVLNPAEVGGFGALWLVVLMLYPATWPGILIYLALNLVFGTLGHLGVEPFPNAWFRLPVFKHVGSSTFHADHHTDGRVNFGFYTTIWDRIFRTYADHEQVAHQITGAPAAPRQ
jgi:sterol desaturase/sphingolipid hydroxylase (fatty acid hydroxylase superfamily)